MDAYFFKCLFALVVMVAMIVTLVMSSRKNKKEQPQVKAQKIDFEEFNRKKLTPSEGRFYFPDDYFDYPIDNAQSQKVAKAKSQSKQPVQKTEQVQTQSKVRGLSLSKNELSEAQKLVVYSEIMNRKYD